MSESKLHRRRHQFHRGAISEAELLRIADHMEEFKARLGDESPFRLVQINWEAFNIEFSATEAGTVITHLLIRLWTNEVSHG